MPNRQRSRDAAAHLHPPILPPPAEVWRIREAGTPVKEIAARYGVNIRTVYHSLSKYRLKLPGLRRHALIRKAR